MRFKADPVAGDAAAQVWQRSQQQGSRDWMRQGPPARMPADIQSALGKNFLQFLFVLGRANEHNGDNEDNEDENVAYSDGAEEEIVWEDMHGGEGENDEGEQDDATD